MNPAVPWPVVSVAYDKRGSACFSPAAPAPERHQLPFLLLHLHRPRFEIRQDWFRTDFVFFSRKVNLEPVQKLPVHVFIERVSPVRGDGQGLLSDRISVSLNDSREMKPVIVRGNGPEERNFSLLQSPGRVDSCLPEFCVFEILLSQKLGKALMRGSAPAISVAVKPPYELPPIPILSGSTSGLLLSSVMPLIWAMAKLVRF